MSIELEKHNIYPYENLCHAMEKDRHCVYTASAGTGSMQIVAKYIEEHDLIKSTLILCQRMAKEEWANILPEVRIQTFRQAAGKVPDDIRLIVCDNLRALETPKLAEAYKELFSGYNGLVIGLADEEYEAQGTVVKGPGLMEAKGVIVPDFEYTASASLAINALLPRYKSANAYGDMVKSLESVTEKASIQEILPKDTTGITIAVCGRIPDIDLIASELKSVYPDKKILVCKKYDDMKNARKVKNGQVLCLPEKYLANLHINGVDTAILVRCSFKKEEFMQMLGRLLSYGEGTVQAYDFITDFRAYKNSEFDAASFLEGYAIKVTDYAKDQALLMSRLDDLLSSKWLEEENEVIRRFYGNPDWLRLASKNLPGRTNAAIRFQAGKLGLTEGRDRNAWTEDELDILKQHYKNRGCMPVLEKLLPRHTKSSIRFKAEQIGLSKQSFFFTEEEKKMIEKYYDRGKGLDALKEMLPERTRHAIMVKAGKMGLSKGLTPFTEEEDEMIRRYFKENKDLLKEALPARNMTAITSRAKRLGVIRPEPRNLFTEDEDEVIRKYYQEPDGMARIKQLIPGREPRSIVSRAWYLGLAKTSRRRFTEEEEKLICEHYQQPGGIEKLMELLPGHSKNSIQYKACRLGLTKKKLWTKKEEEMIQEH